MATPANARVESVEPDRWRRMSYDRRAEIVGGYVAALAWPVLRIIDLATLPGRHRQALAINADLNREIAGQRQTIETQNHFIDRLNDELRATLPRVPTLPAETEAEFVDEAAVFRVKSRVVGRQLSFYPDERIEGQRLRLLIEDTAARMSAALAEDITRDLELFFAKRGGRHAA